MAHSVWHAKGGQADDVRNFYLAKRCKPSAISKCHAGCNPRLYSAQGYARSSMRGPSDAAREQQETAHEHEHKVSASHPDWLTAGDAANASMGVGVGVGVGGSACMPVCLSFRMKVCVLTCLSVCMQAKASDAACLWMHFCAWTRFCARDAVPLMPKRLSLWQGCATIPACTCAWGAAKRGRGKAELERLRPMTCVQPGRRCLVAARAWGVDACTVLSCVMVEVLVHICRAHL